MSPSIDTGDTALGDDDTHPSETSSHEHASPGTTSASGDTVKRGKPLALQMSLNQCAFAALRTYATATFGEGAAAKALAFLQVAAEKEAACAGAPFEKH